MATIRVTNQSELLAALKTAQGGDTVLLADGYYGDPVLKNDYTSTVTIKAENPDGAVFGQLCLSGVTNLTIEGISATNSVKITDKSVGVAVLDSTVVGTLYCRDVNGLTIDNVEVSGGQFGVSLNSVQNFSVTDSNIHHAIEDLIRITGDSYNGVIENNTVAETTGGSPLHPDVLQMFASNGKTPHDIVIHGNLMYDTKNAGETAAQGIFMSDPSTGGYKNILIEDNLIRVPSPNTIYINGGQENVKVLNNTLMSVDAGGAAIIRLAEKSGMNNSGTTVDGNIAKSILDETNSSSIGDNYIYGKSADLSKIFSGSDYTNWESFVPVEGSIVDFGTGYGAQTRLLELLGEDAAAPAPTAEPAAAPPPTVEPAPQPASISVDPGPELLYSHDATIKHKGVIGSYTTVAHTDALETDSGSIALTFNARDTDWKRGLVSKDSKGTEDAISAWLDKDTLYVRFADGDKEVTISVPEMQEYTDYDLLITFDETTVQVWLNDTLVGEAAMDVDLSQNDQDLVLGAFNGTSSDGTQNAVGYFYDGTITNVKIYDTALTPAELAALDAVQHAESLQGMAVTPHENPLG